MTTPAFTFNLRDDLVSIGLTEDGDERVGYLWFVIAEERATGRRFAHDYTEVTAWSEVPDVFGVFAGLLARIEASGINPKGRAHWREVEPAYGSPFWTAWDRAIDARERADELAGLR